MSDSIRHRLTRGVRRLRERSDWSTFAGTDWADRIMEVAVTDRFHAKQGRSTGRWVIEADGQRLAVYLKRHYFLPWWQGLLAAIWPSCNWSPASQEWEHLEWARAAGLPVPPAVACAEFIGPWGRLQSCLAIEELGGMLPLNEAIPLAATSLEGTSFRQWKWGVLAEVARLTRDLHDRCRFHKDLYLCHFYIAREDTETSTEDWRGRVYLIDLHRLGHHPWTWPLWQGKDLAQLLYSSEVAGVDARDRLRFWRAYIGKDGGTLWSRLLRRIILLRWWNYRRHNRRVTDWVAPVSAKRSIGTRA
jgi:heptose I phosphotransferase